MHPNNTTAHLVGDFFQALAGPGAVQAPSTKTNGDGEFTLAALTPGVRQIQAQRGQSPPLTINDVTLVDGQVTDIGTKSFEEGGVIRGRCRDHTGAPFGNGHVTAAGPNAYSDRVRLDSNGKLRVHRRPAG